MHSFLSKDIAKDKLSSKNHKARHSFIQQLDQLLTKIRSAKDNATANQEPKSEPHPPPITPNRLYPQMKPPAPLPPTAIEPDEGGELYEVPDQKEQPEPSSTEYSSFLPITLNDEEPQVCIVFMIELVVILGIIGTCYYYNEEICTLNEHTTYYIAFVQHM